MIDGLQMQPNRLKVLGNLAQVRSDRQSRLEGASTDIVGSIKTVLSKMDLVQQHQGQALAQHEQAIRNQQSEQEKLQMTTGHTAQMQQQKLRTEIIL